MCCVLARVAALWNEGRTDELFRCLLHWFAVGQTGKWVVGGWSVWRCVGVWHESMAVDCLVFRCFFICVLCMIVSLVSVCFLSSCLFVCLLVCLFCVCLSMSLSVVSVFVFFA